MGHSHNTHDTYAAKANCKHEWVASETISLAPFQEFSLSFTAAGNKSVKEIAGAFNAGLHGFDYVTGLFVYSQGTVSLGAFISVPHLQCGIHALSQPYGNRCLGFQWDSLSESLSESSLRGQGGG